MMEEKHQKVNNRMVVSVEGSRFTAQSHENQQLDEDECKFWKMKKEMSELDQMQGDEERIGKTLTV